MNPVRSLGASIAGRVLDRPRLFDLQQRLCAREYDGLRLAFGAWLTGRRSILDVGCGTGTCAAKLLSFETVSYLGVDVQPAYVASAQRRYPKGRFLCTDAAHLDLPHRSFDAVLMFSILHHLVDNEGRRVLNTVNRVLARGGIVLSAEPVFPVPRHHHGLARLRALASRELLRMDRGAYIRDPRGYSSLWEGFVKQAEFMFRLGLHDFYGLVLTVGE